MSDHRNVLIFHEKIAAKVLDWVGAETVAHTCLTDGTNLTCCQRPTRMSTRARVDKWPPVELTAAFAPLLREIEIFIIAENSLFHSGRSLAHFLGSCSGFRMQSAYET